MTTKLLTDCKLFSLLKLTTSSNTFPLGLFLLPYFMQQQTQLPQQYTAEDAYHKNPTNGDLSDFK